MDLVTILAAVAVGVLAFTAGPACNKDARTPVPSASAASGSPLDEALKADDRLIIDVRTPGEFAAGHVPDAVNIPVGDTDRMVKAIGDAKDRPVVVYCRSGSRSGRAKGDLVDRGYTGVVNGGGVNGLAKRMGVKLAR